MNLASGLSLLRLCLVPVLLVLAWRGEQQVYFWLLVLALATDAADGFLARRFVQASPLGARLDSYADSALFLTVPVGIWLLFPAHSPIWRQPFSALYSNFGTGRCLTYLDTEGACGTAYIPLPLLALLC